MNVSLVPLKVSHAHVISKAMQNPNFIKGLLYDHPLTLSEAKKDIQRQLKAVQEKILVARSIKVGGRIVGRIGLRFRDKWTIWYWIAPEVQRKGYLTEAIQLFLPLCPDNIWAEVNDWNVASHKALLRAGFKKQSITRNGKYVFERKINVSDIS